MEYLIDYLSFTIKNDKNFPDDLRLYDLSVPFIFDFLGLSDLMDNFINIGARNHYSNTYLYNNVRIYECSDNRQDMGIHIELTGQGCRFMESHYADKNPGHQFSWFTFFKKLYLLLEGGLSVKICRIDYAFDDFDGILDMEEIRACTLRGERVSLYRVFEKDGKLPCCREIESGKFIDSELVVGKTLNYGNKKSNSYCKIYDKKAEQLVKYSNDKKRVSELKKIKHWVRFEITFKNNSAIKLVNSMIRLKPDDFIEFLAEVINTYIRFVNIDDKNKSRCSLKEFWLKFIGTVKRAKLSVQGLCVNSLNRAVQWLSHSLSPTLSALIERLGKDSFFELINKSNPKSRYKSKHFSIINSSFEESKFTCLELWESMIPKQLNNAAVLL